MDQYEILLSVQGGGCAICGFKQKHKRLAVDHDHACCSGDITCGKCVRGLLCEACNHMLGKAQDDSDRLRSAADYVDKWRNR